MTSGIARKTRKRKREPLKPEIRAAFHCGRYSSFNGDTHAILT